MPPKGRKAAPAAATKPKASTAATNSTKSSETAARNTRGKRVAEAPPEEEPISRKTKRGAKKATGQQTVDELANDAQTEAPKRRGRSAKATEASTEAPPVPKRGRAASKKAENDKAKLVVKEPEEEITIPKSRGGRAAKTTKAESKVIDSAGIQATETKKRGRAAANQLKDELKETVAESSKDAPRRRGRVAKADVMKVAEPAAEDKPKRGRPAAAKKRTTAVEPESVESSAPKTGRGRKKQEATTDPEPEPEATKPAATGRAKRGTSSKASEPAKEEAPKGHSTRTKKMGEPKSAVPKTGRGRAAAKKDEAPAADELAATTRKGRGRPKKGQPTEATDNAGAVEAAEPAADMRRESKRVSIAPGDHPEASTPAKKTPAPSKHVIYESTPGEPSTSERSPVVKSSVRGKRTAVEDSAEPPSSPAPKRAKRDSTITEAEEKSASVDRAASIGTQSRRKTIAGPTTPRTSAASPKAPRTVPANRKTAGHPSKPASSVSKQTPRSGPVSLEADKHASEGEDEEGITSRGVSSTSTHAKATPKAAVKPTPSTPVSKIATQKPPKTAPPKKTAKDAGAKRKRVSSPGPASKRRNIGSADVETQVSDRPSLAPTTPRVTKALQAVIDARPKTGPAYWLMKAEPDSRLVNGIDIKFSIDDLAAVTEPEPWSGVRNHVAKNNMIAMREGDLAFFYHSNCKVPGIVGVCEIVGEVVPDETAFERGHPYYDEKSSKDSPTWYNVHVAFRQKFANPEKVTNAELKTCKELENMQYIKQTRLSVSRVEPKEWDFIMQLAGETLQDGPVEKDWVIVNKGDVQPGAEEGKKMIVDEAANAVTDVAEKSAEVVAGQVGEAVVEEVGTEAAAETADGAAHDVAEAGAEEVAETIEEDAALAEAAQDDGSGNTMAFTQVTVPLSEELSFLPDAPPAEGEVDEPDDLPTSHTPADRTKPASRRASAGLTPAPNRNRGGGRAGSRARTLGPKEFAAGPTSDTVFEETLTIVEEATIPEAGADPLSDDLFDEINGSTADVEADAVVDAANRAKGAVGEGLAMASGGSVEKQETEKSEALTG